MRECNVNENFNFSNKCDRTLLADSDNFTFGHFTLDAGRATVAGGVVNGRLYYGVSFCSPEDNFSRRLGRKIAIDSLIVDSKSHKRGVFTHDNLYHMSPPEAFKMVLNHISTSTTKGWPSWVTNRNIT